MLRRLSRRPAARLRRGFDPALATEALEARTLLTNTLFVGGGGDRFVSEAELAGGNFDQVIVKDSAYLDSLTLDLPDYGVDVFVKEGAFVGELNVLGGQGADNLRVENGGRDGQFNAVRFHGEGGNDFVSELVVSGAGGIDVDLGAGDDVTGFLTSFGGVTVVGGTGDDFVAGVKAETAGASVILGDGDDELGSSVVGGGADLFVSAGEGNDRVAGTFRAFSVDGLTGEANSGNVTILTDGGADHVAALAAGGDVLLNLGAGDDRAAFSYDAGGDVILDAESGNDVLNLPFAGADGDEKILLGTGRDTLVFGGGFVKGDATVLWDGVARINELGEGGNRDNPREYFGDRSLIGEGSAVVTVCASTIRGNYRIAGRNLVLITDSVVGGSLIATASGTANLSFRNSVGDDLVIRTAGRADRVTVRDAFVKDNLDVDLGAGSDQFRVLRSGIGGNAKIVARAGNDRVDLRVFSTGGNLAVDLDGGRDRLVVTDNGVGGNFSSDTGDGNDVIVFRDFFVAGAFRLLAGDGADRLTVRGVEAARDVILNTGAGKDRVKVRGLKGGAKLVVQTGADIDKVDVRHVFADGALTIGVGTANDVLFASGVDNARGNAMLNGGPDPNDTLRGNFRDNVVRRFETVRSRG